MGACSSSNNKQKNVKSNPIKENQNQNPQKKIDNNESKLKASPPSKNVEKKKNLI
jgi:hypothetical protein